MTPWTFRAMWPVEDDDAGYREAVAFAETEIEALADQSGARLVGEVVWEMVENDGERWPHTDLVLVAVAPAVPVHPSREQYADGIRYYAGEGLSDPQIGVLLGISRDSVMYVRRKHGIAAGVPPGYRSREQVAEPTWAA